MSETAVCPVCNERYVRGRHGNRYGSGERIKAQRYCGKPACRQRAYRERRDIANNVPTSARKRRGIGRVRLYPRSRAVTQGLTETPKGMGLPAGRGSVTQAKIHQQNQMSATPKKTDLDPRLIPDDRWRNMWRIRYPDGALSDMVNLTRAKDALAWLDERRT
jgi:hypothetical protein